MVSSAAALCAAGGFTVTAFGWRLGLPEVTFLGTAITLTALMALTHASAILLDQARTSAQQASALLTLPLGMAAAAPLLAPHSRWAVNAAWNYQVWSAAWLLIGIASSIFLLTWMRSTSMSELPRVTIVLLESLAAMDRPRASRAFRRPRLPRSVSGRLTAHRGSHRVCQ